RAVLTRLSPVQAEPVDWLWPNRIARGKLALFVGDAGAGKTYLTHDVASRLTAGLGWPDGAATPERGQVILLTSEDGIADTIRPRIDQQGGDPTRIDVLRAVQLQSGEASFTLERDLPALDAAIAETRAL